MATGVVRPIPSWPQNLSLSPHLAPHDTWTKTLLLSNYAAARPPTGPRLRPIGGARGPTGFSP
jgi:hypothetical protein